MLQITKRQSLYGQKVCAFLQVVLKQQARLIESGNCEYNESLMRELVSKYSAYRNYKFTDTGAAIFIKKHFSNLQMLIPRQQLSSLQVLKELEYRSDILLNH